MDRRTFNEKGRWAGPCWSDDVKQYVLIIVAKRVGDTENEYRSGKLIAARNDEQAGILGRTWDAVRLWIK